LADERRELGGMGILFIGMQLGNNLTVASKGNGTNWSGGFYE
jgi:hypothetical protein